MRHALRRPLYPANAAPEIARLVARSLSAGDAELSGAEAVVVTIEEPVLRPEIRACFEHESFAAALRHALDDHLGDPSALPELHVRYAVGNDSCVEVYPAREPPAPARLEWGTASFALDGSRSVVAVGRGPVRRRFPGARNDLALDDRYDFVSRDAFVLRWDRARRAWRLELDDGGRSAVEIRRGASVLVPQVSSILLVDGDVIALTAGPGHPGRLEIRFVRA